MSKGLDPEMKFEAVMEVLAKQEPLSVTARRYNMSEQTLRNAKTVFYLEPKMHFTAKENESIKMKLTG